MVCHVNLIVSGLNRRRQAGSSPTGGQGLRRQSHQGDRCWQRGRRTTMPVQR